MAQNPVDDRHLDETNTTSLTGSLRSDRQQNEGLTPAINFARAIENLPTSVQLPTLEIIARAYGISRESSCDNLVPSTNNPLEDRVVSIRPQTPPSDGTGNSMGRVVDETPLKINSQESLRRSPSMELSNTVHSRPTESALGNNEREEVRESQIPHHSHERQRSVGTPSVDTTTTCKRTSSRKGLKKGEQVGTPTDPGAALRKFDTALYQPYVWNENLGHISPAVYKGSFDSFNSYKLLMGSPPNRFQTKNTPSHAIRLDDAWIGRVVISNSFTLGMLAEKWPAEFDSNGMVRASRVPLGDGCLLWIRKGQLDVDGVPASTDGCYYGWYRGLQLLCGQQGLDAGLFKKRPSFEKLKCQGIHFKHDCMALPPNNRKQDARFAMVTQEDGKAKAVDINDVESDSDVD